MEPVWASAIRLCIHRRPGLAATVAVGGPTDAILIPRDAPRIDPPRVQRYRRTRREAVSCLESVYAGPQFLGTGADLVRRFAPGSARSVVARQRIKPPVPCPASVYRSAAQGPPKPMRER